jgi:predicted  nucleic acid-binding Zn-ribbon protein
MSDNDPNKKLNSKRLEIEMFGLQLNLKRLELRVMEIEDEKAKISENVAASNKRIEDIQRLLTEKSNG